MTGEDVIVDRLFAEWYEQDERDTIALFGENRIITDETTFVYGEWKLVARFPKTNGDGFDVEIDELRMPARSFRLRALPGANSIGEQRKGFIISTGSDDKIGMLLVTIAKEIARGMLDVSERVTS